MMSIVCPLSNAKDHLSATRQVALISYKRKKNRKKESENEFKESNMKRKGVEQRGHTLNQERFM